MATIVVTDIPAEVHRRLKEEARRNRRSMNREALTILEQGLRTQLPMTLPRPIKPRRPISGPSVVKAIREARE